jgi:NAD(P)H-dependent FMN reductase
MATVQKRSRQSRALDMLEAQLKSGVKTEKKTKDVKVPLTESDRRRIEKEMETLKSKLV